TLVQYTIVHWMNRRSCSARRASPVSHSARQSPTEDSPMSDNVSLTSRQQEIYDFICHRIDQRGFPPTIRDIGTAFEIKSPNGVMCHLKALEKKGFITREGKSARAIRPMRRSRVRPGLAFKGLVAAAAPIAAEAQDERIDLHDPFAGPDTFMLQVRGKSMIDN